MAKLLLISASILTLTLGIASNSLAVSSCDNLKGTWKGTLVDDTKDAESHTIEVTIKRVNDKHANDRDTFFMSGSYKWEDGEAINLDPTRTSCVIDLNTNNIKYVNFGLENGQTYPALIYSDQPLSNAPTSMHMVGKSGGTTSPMVSYAGTLNK